MDADPRVLIVGAGPAGLAAARALSRQGVGNILVIDRDDEPGGLPRFCHHPGFGLEYARWPYTGPGFVKRLLRGLDGADVRIACRTTLLSLHDGPEVEIVGPATGLRRIRPQAVILATGIREANRGNLAVPGGRAERGLLTTGQLQQMVARKVPLPPRLKSLIVMGTEHVAFSAIWTARKADVRVIAMIGSEDRIMSFAPLGHLARLSGTAIMTDSHLREIEAKDDAIAAAIVETRRGTQRIAADGIVFTGNWIPETAALAGGPVALDPRTAGPRIDEAMRTSSRGIFAAGNLLHGVESSGWCANEGRHAGNMVARFLRGEIGGDQAGAGIELAAGLDFIVPQVWSGADGLPFNLRMRADVGGRTLALAVGETTVWTGERRRLLRKRRICFRPDAGKAPRNGTAMLRLID
ncbi:MAG TPA: FAD-dependent oxidoreductase [Dongiaceae bacterium]|nr:FAD-dependent oxidoreductase [Dongiaceae bacterium]